jgi:hypothetical protein
MCCYSRAVNLTPNESLAYLLNSGSQLPCHQLNATLQDIWPRLHGPLHHYEPASLVDLFKRAGYVTDGVPSPTTSLTVYRGEPMSTETTGISWTSDRQAAMRYAQGYSTISAVRVVQATAPPACVLARFTYEDEIVVEPGLLRDVEVLGYLPHFKLTVPQ